jgi:hypothetical protein
MNPIKAQRTWNTLSKKWMSSSPFGKGKFTSRNSRRLKRTKSKIKRGILFNLIQVEVVNAITGEVVIGYMREFSVRKLRRWLELRNQRAQVEQICIPARSTLSRLSEFDKTNYPVLVKLGNYQVPYLIDNTRPDAIIKGKQTTCFNLKIVDNLSYLELIANRKEAVMKVFNKIKKSKKSKKGKKK